MVLFQRTAQILPVEMRVDFGGGNAFVAQHFLYGAKIRAAFHQVRGKGMTEGVGGNDLVDARFFDEVFDDQKDHDPGESPAAPVQEQNVFFTFLNGLVLANMIGIQ